MSAAAFTMRCPRCLVHFNVAGSSASRGSTASTLPQYQLPDPTEVLICAGCKQSFKLGEALPASGDMDLTTMVGLGKPELGMTGWVLGLTAGTVIVAAVSFLAQGQRGPAFLILYAITWLILIALGWAARMNFRDGSVLMGFAFVAFEAIGVVRFIWGFGQGMRNWEYMGWMMLIGGILFFVSFGFKREDRSAYGQCSSCGSSGWHWAGCSSSSCGGGSCSGGGGGCGGGGCGGCGGS